jgi:hypothetical protein
MSTQEVFSFAKDELRTVEKSGWETQSRCVGLIQMCTIEQGV